MDNNDDFIPSEPWEDDNFCNDHIDEGHVCSDVEEPVNLINKPRQVCSLLILFPFIIFVFPWELVYFDSSVVFCFCLFFCMVRGNRKNNINIMGNDVCASKP